MLRKRRHDVSALVCTNCELRFPNAGDFEDCPVCLMRTGYRPTTSLPKDWKHQVYETLCAVREANGVFRPESREGGEKKTAQALKDADDLLSTWKDIREAPVTE
jgi:hypothetical protein